MAILVGIDEAGYGPILGPLVVSATVFELSDKLLGESLWRILPRSVCKKRLGSAGRLVINDSKKLHSARGRYQLLQRGVLAALKATGNEMSEVKNTGRRLPATLGALLNCLDFPCGEHFAPYPWYGSDAADYPLSFDNGDIVTAANALAAELNENDIRLRALWSRPVLAGRFNEMVQAVNNKATVLFTIAGELIYQAYREFGGENLQIIIDKHGGRSHYRAQLQRIFPDLDMKIIKEEETTSSYHLTTPGRSLKIHFIARGDARQLPVALASMTSKYVRELLMELLNKYFQHHCPEITPTAGYYQDGRRFLGDLKSHNLDPHLAPSHLLVRQR